MIVDFATVVALLPLMAQALRREPARDALFWATLIVAVGAAAARASAYWAPAWPTGLAATLWITVAVTLVTYAIIAVLVREAWRIGALVAAYVAILGLVAALWSDTPGQPLAAGPEEGAWVVVHIGVSVATYALVTIAAVAALAAALQEGALKRKRRSRLTRLLPSVADCERLEVALLVLGETILALGLATGMGLSYRETGALVAFDHKTVLTVAAFVVIGALLSAHFASGMRGRRAARVVLLAYLLLTLGYPGVKFVTDVLMA